jgi:hypothetical protein
MSEEIQTEAAESVPELVSTVDPIVENIPEPEKTFTQAELDSIVTKRLAKESRKMSRQAELEVENRYLREQASKREVKEPSSPTQDQYSTYEEYLEAKAEYIADKRVEQKLAERETKDAQSKADVERSKVVQTWQQKVDAAVSKYSDYNEVLEGVEHIEIPPVLQSAIMESDVGSDLAYHLGKNPAELERIVALKPYAALMELGKIAAKLATAPAPVAKQVSKAPAPIKPVGGSAAIDNALAPTDDMATFIRKRNLELGRTK